MTDQPRPNRGFGGNRAGTDKPRTRSFTPHVFGKYFMVDRIATGGMAEIFKAKTYSHGGFENLLVIKRILPHLSDNDDFVDMFIDEAKISVALQHPNVVRVYDFGRIVDNFFIAMECVDGKDVRNILRKLARQKQYLPAKFCAFIAYQVCLGLQYAHAKTDLQGRPYGIVHRDVSPSNVLVSYEASIKLVDFGIAKAESNAYETRDGMLKGKFEYMSPEQAEGLEIDSRSDLFSLGIVMYEMMTNRRLFKTDNELATIKRIKSCDFERPSYFRRDLPPELEAICLRALSKDPNDRFESAGDMSTALREFLFPSTSDTLRQELHDFMHHTFAAEMREERHRLEIGSEAALRLKENLPVDQWEGDTRGSMSQVDQNTAVTRVVVPWLAGMGITMTAMVSLVVLAALWLVWSNPDLIPELTSGSRPAAVAPTGLDIVVLPEARILVNGEERGIAQNLTLEDLPPGEYVLRFEADGHVPFEEQVEVVQGTVAKVIQQLEPKKPQAKAPRPVVAAGKPDPEPDPEPAGQPEAAERPEVRFYSRPSGAIVTVDGRQVGTTPVRWKRGREGSTYSVKMSLEGHQDVTGSLSGLKAGQSNSFSLTLEAADPPKLAVTLLTGGWANVYVDGKKLERTAPFKGLEVSPGTHEVRVVNEALELERVETHEFVAGKTTTIRIK
ncbi:MAG: protein kinase [Myxococcales bacterium]|nr:protein kinase [Myxococcales bacterium]